MDEKFPCPTCGKDIPYDLQVIIKHTEQHVIDAIRKDHPEWEKEDGICDKCYHYYKKELGKE